MGKKEKKVFALAEDIKTISTMVPKLEAFIEVHKEIAAGYQKYRKNGGEAITGLEKHLGIKEQECEPSLKTKKTVTRTETKAPQEGTAAKKTKKKAKV